MNLTDDMIKRMRSFATQELAGDYCMSTQQLENLMDKTFKSKVYSAGFFAELTVVLADEVIALREYVADEINRHSHVSEDDLYKTWNDRKCEQ
jgi:hypothetical protein